MNIFNNNINKIIKSIIIEPIDDSNTSNIFNTFLVK